MGGGCLFVRLFVCLGGCFVVFSLTVYCVSNTTTWNIKKNPLSSQYL